MDNKILEAYEKSVLNPKEEEKEEVNEVEIRSGKKFLQQINSIRSSLDILEKMIKAAM